MLLIHCSLLLALLVVMIKQWILDKLLLISAIPNTQTGHYGNTALIMKAFDGYDKGVQVLLNATADVKIHYFFLGFH